MKAEPMQPQNMVTYMTSEVMQIDIQWGQGKFHKVLSLDEEVMNSFPGIVKSALLTMVITVRYTLIWIIGYYLICIAYNCFYY